jgi:predicted GIY-YIG superfamily endonuclease
MANITSGKADRFLRTEAIRAVQALGSLVYAVRTKDDLVKIGVTTDLLERMKHIKGGTAALLALKPGTFEDELAIHHRLRGHAVDGREYYLPTPPVLREVNIMRAALGMEAIPVQRKW